MIDGAQVGDILRNPSVPTGTIHARGNLHYQQLPARSLLNSLLVKGEISSARLRVKTPSLRTEVSNLEAHYSLADGNAAISDLRLSLFGGTLTGNGTMSQVAGDSNAKVKATLHNVSLSQLRRLAGPAASQGNVNLAGELNASLDASWKKSFNDLIVHTDATIHGQARAASLTAANLKQTRTTNTVAPANSSAAAIPIDGEVHGVYTGDNGQIALSKSFLKTPQTVLTMNGVVSNQSALDVAFHANDLHEIETIANLFRTPTPGQPLQALGLAGTAAFQGTVRGTAAAPHVTGQFTANDLHIHGSEWKLIRTAVEASPSLVSLQHGDLEPTTHGKIHFDVKSALTKWAFTNTSPVEVNVDASQLNVTELARLSGQSIPVTGTLAAHIQLHGTELNPLGNGNIALTNLVAYDQPVSAAKVTFSGTGDEAHANLTVQSPAGNIAGNVSVAPKAKTYTATLTSDGIALEKLQGLRARNVDATGTVSLNASGKGSFENPQVDAKIQIPQLVIQKQPVNNLNLQLSMANHIANASLTTSAIHTNIQAKAKVELSGDYMADASVDTQNIPFQPLLAVYAPDQAEDLSGETEVHATLHGPLKNKNLIEAHITIPMLKAAYGKNIQLAATSPIHADLKNGILAVQRGSIKGTDTDLQFQGSIPVTGNAPMSVMLLGTVDLQLAQLFDPDVRSSGQLKFDINSNGSSDVAGKIDIVNAALATADLPVGLQNGNGTLTLTRDRLSISKFQGTIGGGTLTAQGGVALRPNIDFDLGVSANGIRMLYPQGMREGLDASVRLTGNTDAALLGGSVSLTDLSFTNAFDLNSFISQFSGGVATPPTPGFSQNLALNLNVRSSNNINLVSRTLSVDGSANLQVRGTAATPVILGRVNINNGDVILNGDRFVLNGGTVEFVNPSETEPVLNLSLKTNIQQYDVYLRFNGPIDQLRTNYNSDPALPSADIINLLAFGQTTEANSANPSTPANQAAAGLVASQVSSQVTSRVSKIAGISQLSINPVLAGGTTQGPPGANITIQQRVTGNLFVTFSSNVASTQSQTIQGQYQLSPRVALSATRDQSGGFGFDAIIKKTW
jgi:translocation and assembly module TamB